MSPITSVGYMGIDGKRYPVAMGQFARFSLPVELPQLQGARPMSPFMDATVIAYDGGIDTEDLNAEANWYGSGSKGMMPTGPAAGPEQRWLKVGMTTSALTGGSTPAAPGKMLVFKGVLYCASGTAVYSWNGTTWTSVHTEPGGNNYSFMIEVPDANGVRYLVAFNSANANYGQYDGTTWTDRTCTVGGVASTVTGIEEAAGGTGAYTSYITAILEETGGAGTPAQIGVLQIGGTNWSAVAGMGEPFGRGGMVRIGNNAYFYGTDTTSRTAQLYSTTVNTGTPVAPTRIGTPLITTYPARTILHGGTIYIGMSDVPDLYSVDEATGELTLVRHFDGTDPLAGLLSYAGRLWVAARIATSDTRLYFFDGTGWHQPHTGTVNAAVSDVAAYAASGAARIVFTQSAGGQTSEVSASSRLTATIIESPDAVYGLPGLAKCFHSITLQHSALLSGQAVQGRWLLDNGTEVTGGTNSDIGSTGTTISLPTESLSARLRARFYLTNGAAQDLTIYAMSIRATPLPAEREVWTATLILHRTDLKTGGDNSALTDFEDFVNLNELRKSGRYFQAVDPFRLSGQPTAAKQMVFDSQVTFEPTIVPIVNSSDHLVTLPVRLVEALQDVIGTDMLLDASFEQSTAGSAPNAAWVTTGTVTSANVSTAVTAARGSKVLAVVFNGAAATGGREQVVTGLTVGRYYTVGGWIRRSTSSGTVTIKVTDGSTTWRTRLAAAATDSSFIYYEVVCGPVAASSLTISCIGESTPVGTAYYDAITLRE